MSARAFAVNDSVLLRGYENRAGEPCGIVRRATARRVWVWTGATGWGQREWPFDQQGRPVGETAIAFPGVRLEKSNLTP